MKRKFHQIQYLRQEFHSKKKQYQSTMVTMARSDSTQNTNESVDIVLSVENQVTASDSSPSSLSTSIVIKKKHLPLSMASNLDPTLLLSDYSTISNETFKEILVNTIGTRETIDDNQNSLMSLCDHEDILTYLRQWTHLKNQAYYFKLQDEQWSYYHHLGVTENIWTGRVAKQIALENYICYTYGRKKHVIEQRLKKYKASFDQIHQELNQYTKHCPALLINPDRIMTLIEDFLYKDQYRLRIELERRRTMLKLDAQDHQLLQYFYQLKPRKSEVCTLLIYAYAHEVFFIHIDSFS